jgi:hypothetical protein
MRFIIPVVILIIVRMPVYGQGCCSGGGGSSIVGGAASGVLDKHQLELSVNYQYTQSNVFYSDDHHTDKLFDNYYSNYLFFRSDYGITKNLTMSAAVGYYPSRSLVQLKKADTVQSGGIGDLILFPRYNIYAKTSGNARTEIALGVGIKIPLGTYDDSNLVFSHPLVGDIYTVSPPTVQATTGTQDYLLNLYVYRGYPSQNIRFFMNAVYIKKGWNPLGMKFGDYAGVGLFAGKTFFGKLGVTMQLKGEWNDIMQGADDVDLLAEYNVELESTGGRKLFFVPQLSYTYKSLTAYATTDIPLYQYLEGTQVGAQYQITTGLVYRFYVKKPGADLVKGLN